MFVERELKILTLLYMPIVNNRIINQLAAASVQTLPKTIILRLILSSWLLQLMIRLIRLISGRVQRKLLLAVVVQLMMVKLIQLNFVPTVELHSMRMKTKIVFVATVELELEKS